MSGELPTEKRAWFRRRTFGYGWTPVTWQGWLITIASALAFIAADLALIFRFASR
jgi:hypothetical protein